MSRDWSDIDWAQLDRFVTGDCTPRELEAIQRQIEADPELGRIAEAMRTIGDAPNRQQLVWGEREAWASMQQRMRDADVRPLRVSSEHTAPRASFAHRWTPKFSPALTAAAAVVFVAAGVAIIAAPMRRAAPPMAAQVAQPREVVTKRGERATLDLADGSHVVLGPDSRLVIPARFNEPGNTGSRELELSGEAYFTVTHDSTRPFRVSTETAVTEDIGTSFVVMAYPEQRDTRIVVEEGSVALWRPAPANDARLGSGGAPPLVVEAGNMARLDSSGNATLMKGVRVASYVAFTHGAIVFDGARLSEAIPRLERWYDLDISVTDSALRARTFTGSFTSVSAERMLLELSVALDADVTRRGRSIRLTPSSTSGRARE